MKLPSLRAVKQRGRSVLPLVICVETLFFLLPTSGKVEGHAAGYWGGLRLRLQSGNFWARAVLSGMLAALLLAVILLFSSYLAKFVDPPSDRRSSDLDKPSLH